MLLIGGIVSSTVPMLVVLPATYALEGHRLGASPWRRRWELSAVSL